MAWRQHRDAPAPGSPLCRLDSLTDGGCRELKFGVGEGLLTLLLHRQGAEVSAYVNSCPHFSLPLNAKPHTFLLMSGRRIMCAWHCAVFELTTGRCLAGPALGLDLERVPVEVRDDVILMGGA
jgi:nitrite reductase/ring-hydroxylating ferredoxin subunit